MLGWTKRMWSGQPAPYSKSKTFWPDFSVHTATGMPWALASAMMWLPNWVSTRMPTLCRSTPISMALSRPW